MSRTPKEIWCRSGLYYEYVKDWSEGSWSPTNDGGVKYVRADYVEELEAQRKKTYEALLSVTRLHDEVEANLAKAMDALAGVDSFVRDLSPFADPSHRPATALAKACEVYAELTGGKDE